LEAFQSWQDTHADALKTLSEPEKLSAFRSVYLNAQKSFNTPEGSLAKELVDTVTDKPVEQDLQGKAKQFAQLTTYGTSD
ncbi:hypothetical protein NL321_29785, partial [Klebsiella pneumoniae]|nr:hypothetical protein [Klebsiella pneumoniae]